MVNLEGIIGRSEDVMWRNMRNGYTVPHIPHFDSDFFWDKAIIADAWARLSPAQAMYEIEHYLEGQWENGQLPNEVRHADTHSWVQEWAFREHRNPNAPKDKVTSGFTQPPLLIPAALEVGKREPDAEVRLAFYKRVFPRFKKYAEFLLTERADPEDGLITLIHPNESAMDNTPPWREPLREQWLGPDQDIRSIVAKKLGAKAIGAGRRLFTDGRHAPLDQRASNEDILVNYLQMRKISQYGYDLAAMRDDSEIVLIKDVGFNAAADWANNALREMAAEINEPGYDIEPELLARMDRLHEGIEEHMWYTDSEDPSQSGYYSKDARTGKHILIQTAAGLFPLINDIDPARADHLLNLFTQPEKFNGDCTSVVFDSEYHHDTAYWRGVVWPFVRYVMAHALIKQGETDMAQDFMQRVLTRPSEPYKSEYDHPRTGKPLGLRSFAPTAATDIVLAHTFKAKPLY